jgi:hypothetical protein
LKILSGRLLRGSAKYWGCNRVENTIRNYAEVKLGYIPREATEVEVNVRDDIEI